MKKDLHPKYNPVIFVDMTTGTRFISRSTKTSDKKEVIDDVEYSLISIGITSASHPFFTGQKQFVDTEGRIDKFQKRFGTGPFDVELSHVAHIKKAAGLSAREMFVHHSGILNG